MPDGIPLQAAARDAEALSERFRTWGYGHPESHVLLVRDAATAPAILRALRNATTADRALDLLFIYWAGQITGNRRCVLSTHDSSDKSVANGIDVKVLTSAIGAATNVRHRVLILDACNAGTAASQLRHLSASVSPDQCATVFASGSTSPLSREHHRRGYLTGCLLEQLPPGARSLPPKADLLDGIRAAAASLTDRLHQPPFVGIYGSGAPLRLPALRQDSRTRRARAA